MVAQMAAEWVGHWDVSMVDQTASLMADVMDSKTAGRMVPTMAVLMAG